MADEPLTALLPTCVECGRPWLDPGERWRSYIVAAAQREREFDGPDTGALFCPECAEREFRDSWGPSSPQAGTYSIETA